MGNPPDPKQDIAIQKPSDAATDPKELYQGRLDVLMVGLHRLGWEMNKPKAGMFVWPKVPEPRAITMSTMYFGIMLLENGGVAVSPGSGFGENGEGFLRLALVENENLLRQAVRCLERT